MSQHIPDQVQVSQLPELLGVSRSRTYDLISALKISARKVGRQAFVDANQLTLLLRCRDALADGVSLAQFADENAPDLPVEPTAGLVADTSSQPTTEALLAAVMALLQTQQQQAAIAPAVELPDTLAQLEQRLRILQLAADGGLCLPNSELADLLDLAPGTLRGRPDGFSSYGLVFRRRHQGRSVVWQVTRPVPDTSDAG